MVGICIYPRQGNGSLAGQQSGSGSRAGAGSTENFDEGNRSEETPKFSSKQLVTRHTPSRKETPGLLGSSQALPPLALPPAKSSHCKSVWASLASQCLGSARHRLAAITWGIIRRACSFSLRFFGYTLKPSVLVRAEIACGCRVAGARR